MRILVFCSLILTLVSCGGNDPKPAAKVTNVDQLFKMYPDSLPIIIQHGNLLLDRYDYEHALNDGAKAFRIDSNNTDARLLYANALNNRAQRSVSDVMSAQRHFMVVVNKQPKNTKALVALGSTFAQQGDNEHAFYYINQALKVDKRYRDAYVMKGSIYLSMNNRDLAKSSYQTAIEQDPKFFEGYLFLGDLYLHDKELVAIEYYRSAVDLKPTSMDAMYSLAYGYQEFGQSEQALQIYRKMAKQENTFTPSYFEQGWIKQFQQNDIDSAMIFYNLTLEKEPRFVEAWHNLGMCYEAKKDIGQALKSYSNAIKYNEDPEFTLSREAADRLR